MDEPENLTLHLLRRIDGKVDRLGEDMREVKQRLGAVEGGLALVNHSVPSVSRRVDRLEDRIERIERRLELTSA